MDNKRSQTLSPCSSPRSMRRSSDCGSSPEFEFWMVRNPSFPQPNILSADELFVDGVLLPLHLLPTQEKPDPPTKTPQAGPEMDTPAPEPDPEQPGLSPAITDSATASTPSKRWKDIFRKSEKKNSEENEKDKEKAKKKEKKSGTGGGGTSSAELNINIWPFSRSRSAGNTGTRPKLFPGAPTTRKVNSAPCSRSNSSGESKSRKWPSSPGRVGVHLGRSSPVWQVRRGGSTSKNSEPFSFNPDKSKRENHSSRRSKLAGGGSGTAKTRVLNLNVPMCIGYGHHLSCRSDDKSAIGVSGGSDIRGNNNSGNVNVGSKLFNLRSFFTRKSVVTSH